MSRVFRNRQDIFNLRAFSSGYCRSGTEEELSFGAFTRWHITPRRAAFLALYPGCGRRGETSKNRISGGRQWLSLQHVAYHSHTLRQAYPTNRVKRAVACSDRSNYPPARSRHRTRSARHTSKVAQTEGRLRTVTIGSVPQGSLARMPTRESSIFHRDETATLSVIDRLQ